MQPVVVYEVPQRAHRAPGQAGKKTSPDISGNPDSPARRCGARLLCARPWLPLISTRFARTSPRRRKPQTSHQSSNRPPTGKASRRRHKRWAHSPDGGSSAVLAGATGPPARPKAQLASVRAIACLNYENSSVALRHALQTGSLTETLLTSAVRTLENRPIWPLKM